MGFMNNLDVGNSKYNQVGPLIDVKTLRETFLFGIDVVDAAGNALSDESLQRFINIAISVLEKDLDISVMPRLVEEHKDYFANDYYEWGLLNLNRIPVIELAPQKKEDGTVITASGLRIVYLRDDDDLETVLDIPRSWIRMDPFTGTVRLVPNNRFPGKLAADASGSFFPELFRRNSTVPDMWVVTYWWGFKEGCIPEAMNAAIGLMASIYFMNAAADLTLGAGIASQSLSLDGMSQGITSTASAENTTFSAKVKEYNRLLYGDKTLGTRGIIPVLRDWYKGATMSII